jgi:hypothetical protein
VSLQDFRKIDNLGLVTKVTPHLDNAGRTTRAIARHSVPHRKGCQCRVELMRAYCCQSQDELVTELIRYSADLETLLRRCNDTRRTPEHAVEPRPPFLGGRSTLHTIANEFFLVVGQHNRNFGAVIEHRLQK